MISIEFLLTSLVVVLIPGTGVLYTVSTGLFVGKRASLFAALGCTFGIIPALLASVFGLATIFHASTLAFGVIKYIGVIYLLYMAWVMWRSASSLSLKEDQEKSTASNIVLKGFLINILNPKLSIFFLAFLPQFIISSTKKPLTDMLILGIIFMLMTFIVFVVYGVMASKFSEIVIRSKKINLAMQRLFAGSFAILGVKLAFDR